MIVAGNLFSKKFVEITTDEDREHYHDLAMRVMQTILKKNDGVMLENDLYQELTSSLNMLDGDADKFIVSAEMDGLLETNAGRRVVSFANHASDKKDTLIMQETIASEKDEQMKYSPKTALDIDDIFSSD